MKTRPPESICSELGLDFESRDVQMEYNIATLNETIANNLNNENELKKNLLAYNRTRLW